MKYETKYKIVHWVEKVLGINEDHRRYWVSDRITEQRKVEIIRVKITMPVREEVMMTPAQIEYSAGAGIISELNKGKFIKYERNELPPMFEEPMIEVLASLRVVQP
jgi:hypothetical protein